MGRGYRVVTECAAWPMHNGVFLMHHPIMVGRTKDEEGPRSHRYGKLSCQVSGSVILTIWGDPIIGQALALLLRNSGYQTRVLRASPSGEPLSAKEDSRLLLLTPTHRLSPEQRQTLLAELRNTPGFVNIPVFELVTPPEETPAGGRQDESWHRVPWPCMLEELERRIEAVLSVTRT